MPMNPEIKAQWGEWLLKHADKQGYGVLRRSGTDEGTRDTFCCLGGLCELAVAAGVVSRQLKADGNYSYGDGSENARIGVLPWSVITWAGLEYSNPTVDIHVAPVIDPTAGGKAELSFVNDTLKKTFPEIWTLIDAQL